MPSIHYGKALTSDEVLECLEANDKQKCMRSQSTKKGSEKTKQGKKILEDEIHCQLCGAQFKDGDKIHALVVTGAGGGYCTGFDIPPDMEEEWLCQVRIRAMPTTSLIASNVHTHTISQFGLYIYHG